MKRRADIREWKPRYFNEDGRKVLYQNLMEQHVGEIVNQINNILLLNSFNEPEERKYDNQFTPPI